MNLSELLPELEDRLRQRRVALCDVLMPGIGEEEVRSALSELSMDAPGELVTWYAWHNGISPAQPLNQGQTLFDLELKTLDGAIAQWRWLKPGPEIWDWNPTWLPFASSSGMSRYAVDCTPPQGEVATVRVASPDAGLFDEKQQPSVSGLATVVQRWITALDEGWITYLEDAQNWDDPGRKQIPLEWRITGFI